jgi:hypothetical protein
MKYIKKFNESTITPDENNLNELMDKLRRSRDFSYEKINEISENYDVKFIPLKDFDKYLETEKEKKSVPPPIRVGPFSFLVCYNYYLKKVIVACDDLRIVGFPPMTDIIRHEFIHKEQDRRRGDFTKRHLEMNPSDGDEYWNDYDEIMAYSNNLAHDIYRETINRTDDVKKAFKIGWVPRDERSYRKLIFDMQEKLTPENYNRLKKLTYQYLVELFNKGSKETIHTKINKK